MIWQVILGQDVISIHDISVLMLFKEEVYRLTVLIWVVWAVNVPVTELLSRLAWELIQTGSVSTWAALLWAAVCGIYIDVVIGAFARPTSRGGEAQVLAAAIVFWALVWTWDKWTIRPSVKSRVYYSVACQHLTDQGLNLWNSIWYTQDCICQTHFV